MEKNGYIHFVDERDFKEVRVVGKGKSKKNRAVGFVFNSRHCGKYERGLRSQKRLQQ